MRVLDTEFIEMIRSGFSLYAAAKTDSIAGNLRVKRTWCYLTSIISASAE